MLMKEMGFQELEVESDYNTTIQLVKGKVLSLRSEMVVVSDSWSIALDFRLLSFSFVHCENNIPTDMLAKYGLGYIDDVVSVEKA